MFFMKMIMLVRNLSLLSIFRLLLGDFTSSLVDLSLPTFGPLLELTTV